MAKLRIGVLHDYWWGEEEERAADQRPKRKAPLPDVVEVYEALKESGHTPVYLRLDGSAASLAEVAQSETDLIFNLVESFAGGDTQDHNVAGFLELLGRRFTGTGSRGLHLAQDKALAKKIFAFHQIPTPEFAIVYRGRSEHAHDLSFPVIVKPAGEDGSIGIHFGAVCNSIKELMERIDYIHAEFDSDVLIEEYIEGRELYLSVLGNRRLAVFPPREIFFEQVPEDVPKFATFHAKWNEKYRDKWGIKNGPAKELPEGLEEHLKQLARKVYRVLKIQGFGRIDVRLTPTGDVYVIEANPNPSLTEDEDFAQAALSGGMSYDALITEILNAA